jgi:hypothetical protein
MMSKVLGHVVLKGFDVWSKGRLLWCCIEKRTIPSVLRALDMLARVCSHGLPTPTPVHVSEYSRHATQALGARDQVIQVLPRATGCKFFLWLSIWNMMVASTTCLPLLCRQHVGLSKEVKRKKCEARARYAGSFHLSGESSLVSTSSTCDSSSSSVTPVCSGD